MKTNIRLLIFVLLTVVSFRAFSQGSAFIMFTEKGEKFTVFLNGEQKNSKPGDYVRVDNIYGPTFKVRVVFQDPAIREINKTIFNKPSSDMFYVAKPGKKGDYILEHTTSDYVHQGKVVNEEKTEKPAVQEKQTKQVEETKAENGKTSKGGCKTPMSEPDFQASVIMISNAPFEGPKLNAAKKMVESHCLTCDQITEVMYMVSHEASRLAIAKSAYLHCFDTSHYDKVKDVLNSSKLKDDLNTYIESVK